jgi:hypothetical protein
LLSWGGPPSFLFRPDGNGATGFSVIAGVFIGIGESPGELEVGASIEPLEALEAELSDPAGAQIATGDLGLVLDPIDDQLEVAGIDVALVRRADEPGAELRPIEALAAAAALNDPGGLVLAALEAGEAPPAALTAPAAADRAAAFGRACLENLGGGAATRTIHHAQCTRGGVRHIGQDPYM